MYILFGSGKRFGTDNLNDVWSYTYSSNQWERVRCGGELPPGMYGPTAVLSSNFIYTFGGTTGSAYFSALFRLCLVTKHWKKMAVQ